ncbi:MAG: hypothetical protein WDZ54_02430 [Sneathiella sp.]
MKEFRKEVYDACAKTVKVYKFDAVLHKIITARLGRNLGPISTMSDDLRQALYRLALQLQKERDYD